ncbi:MAG: cyanophycinase [Verrucomicrobiales bacterium]|nr:cyanophycinase [Verrucomicrobiales bacterium]
MTRRALLSTLSILLIFVLLSTSRLPGETRHQPSTPPKGHLIIHGGGPLTKEVMEKFVELGGGQEGHLVVVPTSGQGKIKTDLESMPSWIRGLEFGKISILHTRSREVANTEEFLEPLKTATAIWFSGGRQWRTTDAYLDTLTAEAFHSVYQRGGVIAGSSAGATVQGSYLVRGAPEGNHIMMAEGRVTGFGFLPDTAIDQHAIKRKRLNDMIPVIEKHPHLLGIAVDEGTALLVHDGTASVLGQSKVALYDSRRWKTGSDRYFFLEKGQKFDLASRKVLD